MTATETPTDEFGHEADHGTLLNALERFIDWDLRRQEMWDGERSHSWAFGDGEHGATPIEDTEDVYVAEDAVHLTDLFHEAWRRVFEPGSRQQAADALSDLAGWIHPADCADPAVIRVAARDARRLVDRLEAVALGAVAPNHADQIPNAQEG